ncbi:MAG: bifunctional metallophosphatase/5'-nucleotidase [Candidatus Omnitrophica bacterium]|nr:bifunctional metallophosphatase/5'-nucleotidase [Candidatus Omnitrophota bacterium]
MKILKLALFNAFLLFAALFIQSAAYSDETRITIFHTSDLHDHSQNIPQIARFIDDQKKNDPNVLFVDTGDWFNKGDLTELETRGEAIVSLMSLCRYDAVIMGNHEYSFGARRLIELATRYSLPLLAANCAWSSDIPSVDVPASKIYQFDGASVAVLGLASHYLNHKVDDLVNVHFDIDAIRSLLDELDAQADILVLLTHVGGKTDLELVEQLPRVDLILGGHDHHIYREMVYNDQVKTILHHSGRNGECLGKIVFGWDGKSITDREATIIDITQDMPADPRVQMRIQELKIRTPQLSR